MEGESFVDLVEPSMKEEGGQHVHGWEDITLNWGRDRCAKKVDCY
jgi:hypothetical protein